MLKNAKTIEKILLLDTIGSENVIGFFDGKKLHTKIVKKEKSHRIHLEIEKLFHSLKIENWQLKITAIAVVSGPGSFTGVRTGVTIANALAYALKIPIYATDSLTAQLPLEAKQTSLKRNPTSRDARSRISDSAKFLETNTYRTVTLPASHTEVYSAKFKSGKMVGKIELKPKVEIEHCSVSTKSNYRLKNLLNIILSGNLQPQTQILPIYIKRPNITKPK